MVPVFVRVSLGERGESSEVGYAGVVVMLEGSSS
jgi:hypothetical protein